MIMRDGFSTIIIVGAGAGGVMFKEKRVKPPGLDRGGKIDTTSMRNDRWRTSWTKALKTMTDVTAVVEWDPMYWNDIVALMEIDGPVAVSIQYPDGELHDGLGSLDKFDPGEHSEGEQPTATITITFHNVDADNVESAGAVVIP